MFGAYKQFMSCIIILYAMFFLWATFVILYGPEICLLWASVMYINVHFLQELKNILVPQTIQGQPLNAS